MVKNLNKVFLIVVFIIIVGIIIINNNKDAFGATSGWTSGSWYSTFGPSATTNYGFLQLQTNLPAGPYLLPDPGWTQPTQANASIIAASVTYINILGIPSVTSNISDPVGFTWPTENSTYSYSPTCISGIPNNYLYSTTANGITTIISTVTTQPLKLVSDTLTTFSTGPWDTKGEYGAFNAYFQYDKYASMFMNNDAQFVPFTVNATYVNTVVDLKPLAGVSCYSFFGMPGFSKNKFTENVFPANISTISYNNAIGIPADFAIAKKDTATNVAVKGTPGFGMNSLTTTTVTPSQIVRINVITGVLIAIHSLISQSIKQLSTAPAPLNNYTSNILLDLNRYYAPLAVCKSDNFIDKTKSTFYVSNNTSHAIYLTLMARDSWINNQLMNINLL
jgi:hypothetical protein